MNNPIITISDLHISFKNNEILKNINLNINEGDFIYLIGETGSGKSSLLKSLYKEIDFQKGFISVGEFNLNNIKKTKIAYLRRQLGIIFQDFQLLSDRNIYKNLEFVLHSTGWKEKHKIKERIIEVLISIPEIPIWIALSAALPREWGTIKIYLIGLYSSLHFQILKVIRKYLK